MARLPITEFLTQRLKEYDSSFELRKGTSFEALFFKPLQFIVQPLRDEADFIQIGQSFRRILLTSNPDAFNEDAVDSLAANLFVTRAQGQKAGGIARVYHTNPVNREWPAGGAIFTGSNGQTYTNPSPFAVTRAQMGIQIENGLFFYDIPVESTTFGEDNDLEAGGLVSLAGDPDVITVGNPTALTGGRTRETNTQLIDRVKRSIAVRDLVTGKGFNAILFENFPSVLTEIQAIGMGDDEMMRDIIFNTHIGGKVDGYFKTPKIETKSKDFIGLLLDPTRQTQSTRNVQLFGTAAKTIGAPNVDRSNGRDPVVQQVKVAKAATVTSLADLSLPVDLSVNKYVAITIDGVTKNVKLSGLTAAATKKNEIIAFINITFGVEVAFPLGNSFKLVSPTKGLSSEIILDNPTVGTSALMEVFGLASGSAPYVYTGDGPITFVEDDHYIINDAEGMIERVLGPIIVTDQATGASTANSTAFSDPSSAVFASVQVNDILTILTGADAGDYRITKKTDNNNLVLDTKPTLTSAAVNYRIRRTGIKDEEVIFVKFWFNPLSIDIGKLIKLDADGKTRGVRPGREDQTITDVSLLRIKSIELIDPLTREEIGTTLRGIGGYGSGGYGEGPYGIGSAKDYYMVVNSPHERFSAFEDSYIVIKSDFQGFSFRVTYDCVPQVEQLHSFVRSEQERVLDGDILMKHFIPAYVSGEIRYRVDITNSQIPDNETLQGLVREFVNVQRSGTTLDYSDIYQFMLRVTDPFDRFGTFISPFTLKARILNTDGSTTVVTGKEKLEIPTLSPFPKDTKRPLSPRTAHWIADEIILIRE